MSHSTHNVSLWSRVSKFNATATYIDQDFDKWSRQRRVSGGVKEARGSTYVATATGTSDTMYIVLDGRRHVIVDDVLDARNVKAPSCNGRGNQDTRSAALEV